MGAVNAHIGKREKGKGKREEGIDTSTTIDNNKVNDIRDDH